jgi:hypothetical protein
LDPKNFAKPAKLDWYKVSKEKKNVQPKSLEVSPKKFSARSDLKWWRKGGENLFLIPKKLVSRKMQNKKNL